ncbi:nucleotidyltransferase family protein [SAR202 cluster bacterium AC-409-J13_OGT_754m]|nr:nucleotidyltransferase family protein [SAR202 cluster bacterium AC-409-J13_OGT_754m]
MDNIAVILLAAGQSKRMGTPKSLLPWRGRPLIDYQISVLTQLELKPVVVVLGHNSLEVKSNISLRLNPTIAYNPNYKSGKTSSILEGLRFLNAFNARSLMIINVDQPRTPKTLTRLIDEHKYKKALITAPTYQGKAGHPLILSMTLIDELNAIGEQTYGIRAIVSKHLKSVNWVQAKNEEVLLDINSNNDYLMAYEKFGKDPII